MVYSTRRFVLFLTLCHFILVFFSPFSIAIISLGEERANLSAFRTFVQFVPVWICRFPLPLGVWEGLRFVIVALPGLLSYLFWWFSRMLVRLVIRRSLVRSPLGPPTFFIGDWSWNTFHDFCPFRWFKIGSCKFLQNHVHKNMYRHSGSVGRASALWSGGCRFDPRPSHYKD